MKRWDEAVKSALRAYTQRNNYAYFYGAKGQKLTNATMDALIKAEPAYFSRYSAAEIAQIKRNSLNKIGYDCSGFVGWICTGDKQYSTGQFNNTSFKTRDLAAGVAGSILYTTFGGRGRHIGIDIGYGYCCDMCYESTDANIASGKAGVRLYRIFDGIVSWEWSCQSKLVDYNGATNR